jgi:hypothetical protein
MSHLRHPKTRGSQRAYGCVVVDMRTDGVRINTRAPTRVTAWDDIPRARRGRGKKNHRR